MLKNLIITNSWFPYHTANSKIVEDYFCDLEFIENSVVSLSPISNLDDDKVLYCSNDFSKFWKYINPYHYNIKNVNDVYCYLKNCNIRFDSVTLTIFPLDSIIIAFKLKNYYRKRYDFNLKIILVGFDSFVDSYSFMPSFLRWIKKYFLLSLEKKIFSTVDLLVANNTYYNILKERKYFTKNIYLEHAIIKDNTKYIISAENKQLSLFYAGMLNPNVRPSHYGLSVIENYINKSILDVRVNIFYRGNTNTSFHNINFKKNVSNIEVVSFEKSATHLLLFGNIDVNQVQSKVYEYISYGKPIIFFCSNLDDPLIRILSNYPLVLILYDSYSIHDAVSKLHDFLSNEQKSVSYQLIKEKYKTNTLLHAKLSLSNFIKEIL